MNDSCSRVANVSLASIESGGLRKQANLFVYVQLSKYFRGIKQMLIVENPKHLF